MHIRPRVAALTFVVAALSLGMVSPTLSPSGGGFTSDNVELVGTVPIHVGTAGGILHDGYYYVTDPRGVYIYDVAEPAAPELVGSMLAHQSSTHVVFAQEEPDTNGEILLANAINPDALEEGAAGATPGVGTMHAAHPSGPPTTNGWLLIVDVRDKTNPHVIGSLGIYDHTWTCVLDCSYAIGRTGYIVDLTDPTDPHIVADWREHVDGDGYMHDFVEVAPGRVIGSGQPSVYLDLTDPLNPVELARIDPGFHSLGYHGAIWPNDATDPLMLIGAEIAPSGATSLAGSDCNDESVHAVATYDATDVLRVDRKQFGPHAERGRDRGQRIGHAKQREHAEFVKLEEWRIDGRGAYADGRAPLHTLYCGHWFQAHPEWDAGGYLAIAHYDWGTRFLDVGSDGSMEEIGWWQPVGGYTGAAYWITDEIVYVHDYRRGIEILRFTGSTD